MVTYEDDDLQVLKRFHALNILNRF